MLSGPSKWVVFKGPEGSGFFIGGPGALHWRGHEPQGHRYIYIYIHTYMYASPLVGSEKSRGEVQVC